MNGCVYILVNPGHPGLIKIGHTDRDPHVRAVELSSTTGVPFPFCIAYFEPTARPDEIEQELHRHFEGDRVNTNREFFRVSVRDAILTLQDIKARVDPHHSGEGNLGSSFQETVAGFVIRGPNAYAALVDFGRRIRVGFTSLGRDELIEPLTTAFEDATLLHFETLKAPAAFAELLSHAIGTTGYRLDDDCCLPAQRGVWLKEKLSDLVLYSEDLLRSRGSVDPEELEEQDARAELARAAALSKL